MNYLQASFLITLGVILALLFAGMLMVLIVIIASYFHKK